MAARISKLLLLAFLLITTGTGLQAANLNKTQQKDARTLINLLDYISKDYPMAVKDGKVQNKFEFAEMKEFSAQILDIHSRLGETVDVEGFANVAPHLQNIKNQVWQKASPRKIRKLTQQVKGELLAMNLVAVTPAKWPSISAGEEIFAQQCAPCHGATGAGDGNLGQGLDPSPSSFIAASANHLAPLQIYNTTRLGIDGTSMASFPMLSDKEIWNVAFYIKTLNQDSTANAGTLPANWSRKKTLRTAALNSDAQLDNLLAHKGISTAQLRYFQPIATGNEKSLATAFTLVKRSKKAYEQGDRSKAQSLALEAYLQGVEPAESSLRAIDATLVREVEKDMMSLRSSLKKNAPEVTAKYARVQNTLQDADAALAGQKDSWMFNFWAAFSILFREALEALLIVALVLGVLKSIGAKEALPYVHFGWLLALLIGVAGFFAVDQLVAMGGRNRELMEGIGSLIAVFVLLYVGFWLHSTTKIQNWTSFIKKKVEGMLGGGKRWALFIFVFIVVFREAFESVIFLSSLSMGTQNLTGIGAGALLAVLVIAALSLLVLRYSQKLPLTQLFKYSALSILILAVILVGKGVHGFQESGIILATPLPVAVNLSLLGIYATWQTVTSQLVVTAIGISLWKYGHMFHKKTMKKKQGAQQAQAGTVKEETEQHQPA